jgi:hypothetical protein
MLAIVSFVGGLEASAPGKVVTDLIARGRQSCRSVEQAGTYAVPFAELTWLCSPGAEPRLVGRGPGALSNATFTALAARTAGDLREIDLDDARLHLEVGGGTDIRVGALRLHGLPPFAHASSVLPVARATGLALAGSIAAAASALGVLSGLLRGRLPAMVVAASASVAALGSMRSIDRGDGAQYLAHYWGKYWDWLPTLIPPLVALAVTLLVTGLLSRLPSRMWAASK